MKITSKLHRRKLHRTPILRKLHREITSDTHLKITLEITLDTHLKHHKSVNKTNLTS